MNNDSEQANQERAELQNSHFDEDQELSQTQSVEKGQNEQKIEEFYGPTTDKLNGEIKDIKSRLDQPGLKGSVHRLLHGASDQEQLKQARMSLHSAQDRIGDMRNSLDNQQGLAKSNLSVKHEIQKEMLEMDLQNPSKLEIKADHIPFPVYKPERFNVPTPENSKGRSR